MAPRNVRSVDHGEAIDAYAGEVLVVCPRCAGCARSAREDSAARGLFAPRRLVCGGCGLSRRWADRYVSAGASRRPVQDDYFCLPLWLQIDCTGEVLWAYNWTHLGKLEEFVGARLRERHNAATGRNRALTSRLPRWMKLAKHRDAVMRKIAELRSRR